MSFPAKSTSISGREKEENATAKLLTTNQKVNERSGKARSTGRLEGEREKKERRMVQRQMKTRRDGIW